jgi:hypothetical protein
MLGGAEGEALLQVRPRLDHLAPPEVGDPQRVVGVEEDGGVGGALALLRGYGVYRMPPKTPGKETSREAMALQYSCNGADTGVSVVWLHLIEDVEKKQEAALFQPMAVYPFGDIILGGRCAHHPIQQRLVCVRPGRMFEHHRDTLARVIVRAMDEFVREFEESSGLARTQVAQNEHGRSHLIKELVNGLI